MTRRSCPPASLYYQSGSQVLVGKYLLPHDPGTVLDSPDRQVINHRPEFVPVLRQLILDRDGLGSQYSTLHQLIHFHILQLPAQHLAGYALYFP